MMALTYQAIATVTVGSGGAANIEFTSIPGTYTDLNILASLRTDRSGENSDYVVLRFNDNSATNYSYRMLYGSGTSTGSNSGSSLNRAFVGNMPGPLSTASTFNNHSIYIPNYAGSNQKSISADSVTENNGTFGFLGLFAALWNQTSAITKITLLPDAGSTNFVQYSTATLYGIKKD